MLQQQAFVRAPHALPLTFCLLQFDQMSVQASQYGDELRMVKGEVAEVNRLISRLQSEIEAVKAQVQLEAVFSFSSDIIFSTMGSLSLPPPLLSVAAWRTSWLRRRSVESWL